MSETIIKVENLSKRYKIGKRESYYSLRDKIGSIFDFKNREKKDSEFWALKDINFEVKAGESVGIIGRNGAGKSTLLKILSQITPPTTGKITLRGRVASLLEVGTGFNPELTGRENIFLNGAILGMTRAEIKRKFDEIVAFAEIEQFLDTPVKRYSSGMYMRLAFAVAAHLESEILIVDEVLAVGDAQFQKKCLGKMDDVAKKEGRTVLFVSHNMGAIRQLCAKVIYLDKGFVNSIGSTNKIIDRYEKQTIKLVNGVWINEINNEDAVIKEIKICDEKDNIRSNFFNDEDIIIKMKIKTLEQLTALKIGFDLVRNGEVVFRTQQVDGDIKNTFNKNFECELVCKVPKQLLNVGEYLVFPLLTIHCKKSLMPYEPVLSFDVKINAMNNLFHSVLDENNHPGYVFPMLNWSIKNV